ncbi:MAG: hypothetical protein MTP17_04595 [Candidatus Midichloria sp.]|nr:MAG: hypothetical protein MTP17_04595 [Candidatus Midichloria sp.]
MNKNCLLIFTIFFLTSCQVFLVTMVGTKGNPKDFKEKREPRDNQHIAGLKKNPISDSTSAANAKQNS